MNLDEEIKSFYKIDENKAFQLIVDHFGEKVFNNCAYQLRSKEDAEDVTQEVFTSIFLSLDNFEGNSKLSTWIYAITSNKCKEFIRTKTRKKRLAFFIPLFSENSSVEHSSIIDYYNPSIQLEDKEKAKILFEAIDKLSENQKRAFILSKIDGYSYIEISEMMELTVSSVESLLFRSKKELKRLLGDYYEKNKL